MPDKYLLAIDQGTTSSRVVVFDQEAQPIAAAQEEFPQFYPQTGWVEHDAEQIWSSVAGLVPRALDQAGLEAGQITAIGITNQRETTVVWDRQSGAPIHHAIVWQDRRTAEFCAARKESEPWLQQRTGLVLDPYFSATKIRWILDHVSEARRRAVDGRLAAGTIDSFLIWRLTGGQRHVTDVTNASRTLLLDLENVAWDDELCRFFEVPRAVLPEVLPSCGEFGVTRGLDFLPDGIPITGAVGDQQSSLFGQGCFAAGDAKCTYGTGAFLLVHTGAARVESQARLLATLAASTGTQPQYALEGSLFVAGAAVQWLRDGLKMIAASPEVDTLAAEAHDDSRLVFVPALVGLGAPHWTPAAQGTIFGITRATTTADLARATLEGLALQVQDLLEAVACDFPGGLKRLRVDGGAARSDYLMQLQADVLQIPVERVAQGESTALGAALLAGLGAGVWNSTEDLKHVVRIARTFEAGMPAEKRAALIRRWQAAVKTVIQYYGNH
jgi:glycerol kinase